MCKAPLFSIIVPVYNAQKYLDQCIESIVAQTYTDFELLLINDGSIDESDDICTKWAKADTRIKYFVQENSGAATARNKGLDNMHGEYLVFIDADDFVVNNLLETMFKCHTQNNVGMVIFDFQECDKDGKILEIKPAWHEKSIVAADLVLQMFCKNIIQQVVVWNRSYKASLWADLRFPNGQGYEDEFVAHTIISKSGTIALLPDKLYFYRQIETSTMHTETPYKKADSLYAYFDRYCLLQQKGILLAAQNQLYNFLHVYLYLYPQLINGDLNSKQKYKKLYDLFLKLYYEIRKYKIAKTLKQKLVLISARYMPQIYAFVYMKFFNK